MRSIVLATVLLVTAAPVAFAAPLNDYQGTPDTTPAPALPTPQWPSLGPSYKAVGPSFTDSGMVPANALHQCWEQAGNRDFNFSTSVTRDGFSVTCSIK